MTWKQFDSHKWEKKQRLVLRDGTTASVIRRLSGGLDTDLVAMTTSGEFIDVYFRDIKRVDGVFTNAELLAMMEVTA